MTERSRGTCRFFGASGAGASGAGASPSAGGGVGTGIFSVIIPIVQPGELSRIMSSAFTARTYLALSSASKKTIGGPSLASLALACR